MAEEVVVDPLTGKAVVRVAARQGRPNRPPAGECPFCPGGLEAPAGYETHWFPNRWPPLPDGRAEVLLWSSVHGASLWELGLGGARAAVDLWAARAAAQAEREDVAYPFVFENRGPEVGATIDHPHSQLYAFADIPPMARDELDAAEKACPLCTPPPDALVVSRSGGWLAWCPPASVYAHELRIAPADHVGTLDELDDAGRDDLAAVLVDALARLDALFGAPMPFMLWWHRRPSDGGAWPQAHVHAHVAPLYRAPGVVRYVAAAELGSELFFNPVDPEGAAAALRAATGPSAPSARPG